MLNLKRNCLVISVCFTLFQVAAPVAAWAEEFTMKQGKYPGTLQYESAKRSALLYQIGSPTVSRPKLRLIVAIASREEKGVLIQIGHPYGTMQWMDDLDKESLENWYLGKGAENTQYTTYLFQTIGTPKPQNCWVDVEYSTKQTPTRYRVRGPFIRSGLWTDIQTPWQIQLNLRKIEDYPTERWKAGFFPYDVGKYDLPEYDPGKRTPILPKGCPMPPNE